MSYRIPAHYARMLRVAILISAAAPCTGVANAAEPPSAVTEVQRWAEAAFAKPELLSNAVTPTPSASLTVVQQSHKVLRNRSVWGTPLTLGTQRYTHGLYMDAPAVVRVRLAQPATEFTAVVGIDNNQSTQSSPTVASARFHVSVGGQRLFSTPICKLADGPRQIHVPLDGATELVLEVDDGGDGRSHDQCVWADPAVKLADGTLRRLDEMPDPGLAVNRSTAPFSFIYDGQPSDRLLSEWQYTVRDEPAENKARRVLVYQCPKTGLRLECQLTAYADAAAVDWMFYLSNEGKADTPILESFLPLDTVLMPVPLRNEVTLRWSHGDSCVAESYLPHDELLAVEAVRRFTPFGGRPSNSSGFPFFNLCGTDGGWILAVGWSGQWMAELHRQIDGGVRLRAGMESTRFRLRPGERVRSPRIVLLHYDGRRMIDGHNQFRRLMLQHYVQRRDGQPAVPPICHNTAATVYRSEQRATEANQLAIIEKAAQLGIEAYWMDAYWYPQPWGSNVGNWCPRPEDFPRGMRPLADAAHRAGMKFVLWFEPERVEAGTRFDREHPEFLIKLDGVGNRLFNLADPAARQFLTDFLDQRIKQWGIDVYRQDFNFDPLPYWRKNDADDRRGITEMRYVEGLYQMWSDLIRRNPHITIDNCASGGRRIDLETCSLSYPLWRSDFNDIGEGLKGPAYWPQMGRADQVHVGGLALYIPFQAGPLWDMHPYNVRSAMTSTAIFYERILHPEFPDQLAAQAVAEIKRFRHLFLGDIYPLMKLTTSQADWYAYQLDRSDLGEGCVLVFRRPESTQVEQRLELVNIAPESAYLVSVTGETYEHPQPQKMMGREFSQTIIRIEQQPGSALLWYQRAAQ
ncbi:MAG: hypothetical protein FJ276_03765 [Planctomycetes bacterium]|nr:hypothetical protein [Planctomycetota bacterium]